MEKNKDIELVSLFHNPNIVYTIKKMNLQWVGHAWKSQNAITWVVLEPNLVGKIVVVKKDVKTLGACMYRKGLTTYREESKNGCEMEWSLLAFIVAII